MWPVFPALVGGNCNNGSNCGGSALNLNNSVSNANWNIGSSHSYFLDFENQCAVDSIPLGKNKVDKGQA